MVKKIIYPIDPEFYNKLKRINRKKAISLTKIEDTITYFMQKHPNYSGIKILPFRHVKSECFVKFNVLDDHIKVIVVSCSGKGFGV